MFKKKGSQPFYLILLLILSGEAVFILPFVLARIFRPTFLEVFAINNLELGTCFSIYGIVAFVSYFIGGPLADKYHPRYLISVALVLTALGGIYLSTYPSYPNLKLLFGYWGFTTIFLFWSAMIKATRIWGGTKNQGIAFGYLDGGRGLVAAGFGSMGVLIFSLFIPTHIDDTTFIERQQAFQYVILFSSLAVGSIGILVFIFLRRLKTESVENQKYTSNLSLKAILQVLKMKAVWLLMVIILCAYVGYKITDIFSLYANEVMGFDEIKSAKVGTYLLYMRPIIGVVVGLLADKTRASLWIVIGFLLMLLTSIIFASGIISNQTLLMFILSIGFMALGVYSARVLYFATFNEAKIPMYLTGTAVGIISVIGYTPDIFAGPAIGMLLDNSPGELGHQKVFIMMAIFALIGIVASFVFLRTQKKTNTPQSVS